jgi:HEAT repeat protein
MSRLFKVLVIVSIVLFFGNMSYAADTNEFGQLLDKIKTYDYGQSRADLTKMSDMIRDSCGKPEWKVMEKQLDDFLKSDANYAAKDFVCRELSVSGTEASVPVLASMLTDQNNADMARYAIERIPGDNVNEALRQELSKAGGNAKVGIINTLGVRGDKKAVAVLAGLISDANQTIAVAAVAALGRIDDPCATEAIAKAEDKATGVLRTKLIDAYLQCADRLTAKGQKEAASAIYKRLYDVNETIPVRVAAVRGMIMTAGDKTGEKVVEILKSNDPQMQTAAIGVMKDVAKTDVIKAAAGELTKLGVTQQVQLIGAFEDCGDSAALAPVLTAARSTDEAVRIAALKAISVLGDVSTVDMLVGTAVSAKGEEQKAAQNSLYRLKGADVDEAILKKLPEAEPTARVELIRSCEQRNITAAVAVLMKQAKDADGKVRIESIKALRALAGPQDLVGLVELQLAASGAERTELEKTVVAVARKGPEEKGQAQVVLAAMPQAKDLDAKCSLLSVLGRIGAPAALPVLRDALGDKEERIRDAAVRALSDWPTATPAEDLLKVVKTSENPVHKTLALRGYVRLIGLESNRPAEETMKMYKEAMSLAANAADKKMVLSGLGNLKSVEALQMAAGYLEDTELKDEAESAVVKIAESTMKKYPRETKGLLQKVSTGTTNESVREQAQKLLKQGK